VAGVSKNSRLKSRPTTDLRFTIYADQIVARQPAAWKGCATVAHASSVQVLAASEPPVWGHVQQLSRWVVS